jgi:hypothetical protein
MKNIQVLLRKGSKKNFLEAATLFFAQELKLKNSSYELVVMTQKGLVKSQNINGLATKLHDKLLGVVIDSNLNIEKSISTLAHEMVHVKQMATGKLQHKTIRGKEVAFWNGKKVKADYLNRPWEQQAWSQEVLLSNKLWNLVFPQKF